MSPRPSKPPKKPRGIIVWDFDGVLFETARYRVDVQDGLRKIGISHNIVLEVLPRIGARGHFSIARLISGLRAKKISIPDKKIRKLFHEYVADGRYYSSRTDTLLHRLRGKGFVHMILSAGHSSFQRKKMFFGCGTFFPKHFTRIMITTRPKYLTLERIMEDHPKTPIIFIDDTKENLLLAQKHVPGIITVHYSNIFGASLKNLERKILRYVRK